MIDSSKRPASAEVTVFTPMLSPARHSLDDSPVTLGRAAECTIPIKDRYLSRKHAEIVSSNGGWVLKDCGSANGTFLNGTRVQHDLPLKSGDRIKLGDTEIVFQSDPSTERMISVPDRELSATISIPLTEITNQLSEPSGKSLERLRILNALAMELIEDRPLDEVFSFIVDRVMEHLRPSRAAIGVISEGGRSFDSVEVRRQNTSDTSDLSISKTLLAEVVEERKALAYVDVSVDEKLSRAMSIVAQGIHSVLCAPIMIGNAVVGVLYVDYLFTQRTISEEDVRLVAQIGQFAAVKLETTRLREAAFQKQRIDEELRTAYLIQRGLLPESSPLVPGYSFSGMSKPCRAVSGDYYDFVARPDGKVYFVIADVSGKGLTAALLMAGLQAAFRIFTKSDPDPSTLVKQLNGALHENLPQSKFVTLFAGRLDPEAGEIEFANAGHNPPLIVTANSVARLANTDILLGMFTNAEYRNQALKLEPGDALVLYTDGVTEASRGDDEEEFGMDRLQEVVGPLYGHEAEELTRCLEESVTEYLGETHCGDDVTMVVVCRNPSPA
ncbi:MAG TPA: SpoIIE family protein phosphatase [Thermoanaerobaculia bacterium]|nr:SpoIIE family protein phosphatase [Thermoanaerobaculia bacterium]